MDKDIVFNVNVCRAEIENNNGNWQYVGAFEGEYISTDGRTRIVRVGGDQIRTKMLNEHMSFYLNESDWNTHPDDWVEWVGLNKIFIMLFSFTKGVTFSAEFRDFGIYVLDRGILEETFPKFAALSEDNKRLRCLYNMPYIEDRWTLRDLSLFNIAGEVSEWDNYVKSYDMDERIQKYTRFERPENVVKAHYSRQGLSSPRTQLNPWDNGFVVYHLHNRFIVYERCLVDLNETGVNLFLETCSHICPYSEEEEYAIEGKTYLPIGQTGEMSAVGINVSSVGAFHSFVYTGPEHHDITAPIGEFTVKNLMLVELQRGGYMFYKSMKEGRELNSADIIKLYAPLNRLPYFVREFKILGFTKTGDFIGYVVE